MTTLTLNSPPITGRLPPQNKRILTPTTQNIIIPTAAELDALVFGNHSAADKKKDLARIERMDIQRQLIERELARRNFRNYIEYMEPDYCFGSCSRSSPADRLISSAPAARSSVSS